MNPLSAATLLRVWEGGRDQDSLGRAISLITAVRPELTPAAAAELPLGERDSMLLTLREKIFGPDMEAVAPCPQCGEDVEVSFRAEQIVAGASADPEFLFEADGVALRARLPNSADLAVARTRRELLMRCVLESSQSQETISDNVVDALESRMAQADPRADIQLELTCPACGNIWVALFDAPAFFWREIDVWARRVLREVHVLACAYGWSEGDILSLSPWRRRFYLEMLAQ